MASAMTAGNSRHPRREATGRESGTETILAKWSGGGDTIGLFVKGEKCMEVLDLESKATMLSASKERGVPSPV